MNVADTAIDEGIRAVDRGVKHLVILVSMESEPLEAKAPRDDMEQSERSKTKKDMAPCLEEMILNSCQYVDVLGVCFFFKTTLSVAL